MDKTYALRLVVFEYLIPSRRVARCNWLRRLVTTGVHRYTIAALRGSLCFVPKYRAQLDILRTHILDLEEGYDTWAKAELHATETLLRIHIRRLMAIILLISDTLMASCGHATSVLMRPRCVLSQPINASLNVRALVDCVPQRGLVSLWATDPVTNGNRDIYDR